MKNNRFSVFLIIVLLSSCSDTDEMGVEKQPSTSTGATQPILIRNKHSAAETHQAMIKGRLVADHAGCLRVLQHKAGQGPVVIWHRDATLQRLKDGSIFVNDGLTANAAKIGDEIALGGSFTHTPPATVSTIPPSCSADVFWLAGSLSRETNRKGVPERHHERSPIPVPHQSSDGRD